jgi:hypothetical protein
MAGSAAGLKRVAGNLPDFSNASGTTVLGLPNGGFFSAQQIADNPRRAPRSGSSFAVTPTFWRPSSARMTSAYGGIAVDRSAPHRRATSAMAAH